MPKLVTSRPTLVLVKQTINYDCSIVRLGMRSLSHEVQGKSTMMVGVAMGQIC